MQPQSPQLPSNQAYGYVPTSMTRDTFRRAKGLKILCVCELVFAIWGVVFLLGGWYFVPFIPVDIIGILATRNMNSKYYTIFSCLKTLLMFLVSLEFINVIVYYSSCYGHYCISFVYIVVLLALLVSQILCLYLGINLRRAVMSNVVDVPMNNNATELHSIQVQPQQQQQMHPVPQMAQMSQMPQHIHSPHATSGVPGYPYPPAQYYPTYMNQGYPAPFANYPQPMQAPVTSPQMPVSTYPTYTVLQDIPLDTQQPNNTQQSLLNNIGQE